MFADDGLTAPAGFPKGDLAFTNNKVIVARTYADPQYGMNEQSNKTSEDELGHGSRVAGVAAGRQVNAPLAEIQGIASLAFLGNYKVFGTPGINGPTTTTALIAAIDDAVQDGMNVLNLSLGGAAVDPAFDPEQIAIENAVNMGVVVVIAAGNSGPGPRTIASPGTSPAAITAAASSNGRTFAGALEMDSSSPLPPELQLIGYVSGDGVVIGTSLGPFPIVSIALLDATEMACSGLPTDSLSGQVALVRRGNCFFTTKASNVFNAGAAAMVVYNNVDGPAFAMGVTEGDPPFEKPAVMIEKSAGEALRDWLLGGTQASVTLRSLAAVPSQADEMADFSSRGPNINLEIKPDLTAPGKAIHTASRVAQPEPQYSTSSQGTSFSTPIVSGAAALVKQLHPNWSARAIKSAIVNTAAKTPTWNGTPARVIHTGNGRVDLTQALDVMTMLDPVSVSFGLHSEDQSIQVDRSLRLTHLGSGSQTYEIQVVEAVNNPSVHLSVSPASLTLVNGETREFVLTAQLSSPLAGGPFEGYLRVYGSGSAASDLTASFWGGVTVPDPTLLLQVSKSAGSAYTDILSAVQAARAGNIVEIGDSSTYEGALQILYNSEGLPQDGLTLRSAPGQTPTIDATAVSNLAAITVINRKQVTIEGLRLRGGRGGISFRNASGVIRDNTIEDTLSGSSSHGIHLNASRAHILDNTIQRNGRTGIALSASAALIQRNEVNENNEHGISGSGGSTLALFDNEISRNGSNNDGQGVLVWNSQALIKGSRILDTQGTLGDGILGRGGQADLLIQSSQIERSQRMGIALLTGATASLSRSRILDNQDTGLYLSGGSTSQARANLLTGNGKGIQVENSDLTLLDTLVAASAHPTEADGIVATDSVLNVYNSTISGNPGFGISLFNTTGAVHDSILYQNAGGDLSTPSDVVWMSNLIGDGQLAGSGGNFTGDPFFSSLQTLDFSLLPGSPAIDQGGGAAPLATGLIPPVPREDLLFHERPVDGDGDGIAQTDLGAIEFGSSHAPPLLLPVLSSQSSEFTGLAAANTSSEASQLLLRAHNGGGTQLGTYEAVLPAGSQLALILSDAFPNLQQGWVEIVSNKPDLMSFTLLGNFGSTFMDGSALAGARHSKLLFPEVPNTPGQETWFYLINPSRQQVQVTWKWRRPDGSSIGRTSQLAARGMIRITFSQLFGAGNSSGGYVTAEADQPLYGMELFGDSHSRGGLPGLEYEAQTSLLFAAHLASSPDVETILNLINTGTTTDVTLEALDEQGQLISSLLVQNLKLGMQYRKKAREIFGFTSETVVGWLRITAVDGKLAGNITFSGGSGKYLAALPLQAESEGAREFVLSHVAQTASMFTGVTLLNPFGSDALVSLEVFDKEENLAGFSLIELPARKKMARLLNEFVPKVTAQRGGFVRVRSTLPLLAFELFGKNSLDFLSAVPQQAVVH